MMQVINHKDLRKANYMLEPIQTVFGFAGRNAEYTQYWRKLIRRDFARRHTSKIAKLALKNKIKNARFADKMARMEAI